MPYFTVDGLRVTVDGLRVTVDGFPGFGSSSLGRLLFFPLGPPV